jgi:hypothetical protein
MEVLGLEPGALVTTEQAVRGMLTASDNALAQLVADVVDAHQTDAHLRAVGLVGTSVAHRALPTTAADMARFAAVVARGYPTPGVSEAVQILLAQQRVRSRIPAGIDDVTAVVGNKTGDWYGLSAHDVAIVRASFGTYVLAILTDGTLPDDFFSRVAAAVHESLRARRALPTVALAVR